MALRTVEGGVALPPAAPPHRALHRVGALDHGAVVGAAAVVASAGAPVLLQVAGARGLVHAVGGEEGAALRPLLVAQGSCCANLKSDNEERAI